MATKIDIAFRGGSHDRDFHQPAGSWFNLTMKVEAENGDITLSDYKEIRRWLNEAIEAAKPEGEK